MCTHRLYVVVWMTCIHFACSCAKSADKANAPAATNVAATTGSSHNTVVHVTKPQTQPHGILPHATGQLRSVRESILGAKATGTVYKLYADVGDRVKAGQPLLQLDPAHAELNVMLATATRDQAQAQLALQTQEFARTKTLFEAHSVSSATFEKAQAAYDSARANLAQTNANLQLANKTASDLLLRAPFDGIITARRKQIGEVVTQMPVSELMVIVDDQNLEAKLGIPESLVDHMHVGMHIEGIVSPSNKPFAGVVKTIGTTVDTLSHTVEVVVTATPAPYLRAGALVDVALQDTQQAKAWYLPSEAVIKTEQNYFVWLVQQGKAHQFNVRIEPASENYVRIVSELQEQDIVIVAGYETLHEGDAVAIAD